MIYAERCRVTVNGRELTPLKAYIRQGDLSHFCLETEPLKEALSGGDVQVQILYGEKDEVLATFFFKCAVKGVVAYDDGEDLKQVHVFWLFEPSVHPFFVDSEPKHGSYMENQEALRRWLTSEKDDSIRQLFTYEQLVDWLPVMVAGTSMTLIKELPGVCGKHFHVIYDIMGAEDIRKIGEEQYQNMLLSLQNHQLVCGNGAFPVTCRE